MTVTCDGSHEDGAVERPPKYMVHIRVRCHETTTIYNVTIVQPPIATLTLNIGGTSRVIQYTGDELSAGGVLNGTSENMIPVLCEEPFMDVFTVRARAGMSSALSIAGPAVQFHRHHSPTSTQRSESAPFCVWNPCLLPLVKTI